MSFILRSANLDDLDGLYDLSRQFTLMNLPSNKKTLASMLEETVASFAGQIDSKDGVYLFVAEDSETGIITASSLIHGRCGSKQSPNYSYQIIKKDLFSEDLGIGFIHQVLRLKADEDGPTEIGGLLVDKNQRRRPEKLGKQISYVRFCYLGLFPEKFTEEIHVELAPPLTDEGRSEFWEALGRRFTGLPYQEADVLSQQNKEFIESLFPKEDIYLCLLDSKARLVLGRVGEETRAAQHMLESIGFKYINEVDPFDGGPHYRSKIVDLTPIKQGCVARVGESKSNSFKTKGIIGGSFDSQFRGGQCSFNLEGDVLTIAPQDQKRMKIDKGVKVFVSPVSN